MYHRGAGPGTAPARAAAAAPPQPPGQPGTCNYLATSGVQGRAMLWQHFLASRPRTND